MEEFLCEHNSKRHGISIGFTWVRETASQGAREGERERALLRKEKRIKGRKLSD